MAYLSFTGSTDGEDKPRTNLRGIATLFMNVMHLVARPESGISNFEDLTRILFDTLPGVAPIHEAFGRLDIEAAPATPIPLHPGAARFYREMELFR